MLHPALAAFVFASTLMVAACDDGGGSEKDQNYGTDAAVGYTGPTPDANSGQTMDAAAISSDAQKADASTPDGVNDLGVTVDVDIPDAVNSD